MIGTIEIGKTTMVMDCSPENAASVVQTLVDGKDTIQPTPWVITMNSSPEDHKACCGSIKQKDLKSFRPINYPFLDKSFQQDLDRRLGII